MECGEANVRHSRFAPSEGPTSFPLHFWGTTSRFSFRLGGSDPLGRPKDRDRPRIPDHLRGGAMSPGEIDFGTSSHGQRPMRLQPLVRQKVRSFVIHPADRELGQSSRGNQGFGPLVGDRL